MHIPDGYLGPPTCGVLFSVMIPVWAYAARKTRKTLKNSQVPLLAIGAAFSFVIMMFNIPLPGGTTGHAVGAVLVSLLIGPWASCIAISVSLIIQALLFGDGGLTSIGANCFNMAFVMVFAGYYTYKLVSLNSKVKSFRRVIGAAIAGYVGLNIAAVFTAVEFGLQPLLHRSASGYALYCPYGLNVAVPVMLGEHLIVFGWVEAIITGLAVRYLQKQGQDLLTN